MEIWKDIEGYNGKYQISNRGEVKSFSKWSNGKILKGGKTKGSPQYRYVALVNGSRREIKHYYIHKLVAEAFIENPRGLTEVNHIDGNALNNCAENLEWCTHKENMLNAMVRGALSAGQAKNKGKLNKHSKAVLQFTRDGKLVKEWESVNQVMRETGIPASSISKCCNPEKYPYEKTVYGYIWRYKNGKANNHENETQKDGR